MAVLRESLLAKLARLAARLVVAGSALIFVSIFVLTIRSFFVRDALTHMALGPARDVPGATHKVADQRFIAIQSNRGAVGVMRTLRVQSGASVLGDRAWHRHTGAPMERRTPWYIAVDWYAERNVAVGARGDIVTVANWFILLLAAAAPTLFLIHRFRNRHPPGECIKCGYDLRASKDRCPECGMAIPASDPIANPQSRSDERK